jgi:hypothetical protein
MTRLETIGTPDNPLYDCVQVEVPDTFYHDDAYQRWEECGGQVRHFGGETVDMRKLNFVDWVLRQEGAKFPETES